MARAKKRKDGRYQKSFTFNDKRYFVYAETKEQLEEKYHQKKAALKEGKERHDNPKLDEFFEKWMRSRERSIKPATYRTQTMQYNSCANVIVCNKRLGDMRLRDIKPDDIREVQQALLINRDSKSKYTRPNTAQTVNDKIAVLSHIFKSAIEERYIDFNPCAPVKSLRRIEERARDTIHRALTVDEQEKFFQAAKENYYYDVFEMAILTGMRIGEIGALYPSDIYDGAIHIKRTITKISGGYEIGTEAKTRAGERIIPLNDDIVKVIERQKKLNREIDGYNVIRPYEPIFKAPERGLLLATPVDRAIGRICKKAGIEKFTAHAFRATFATRSIELGINPRTIQELLGHTDYKMTMNLYGHATTDMLDDAMKKIKII